MDDSTGDIVEVWPPPQTGMVERLTPLVPSVVFSISLISLPLLLVSPWLSGAAAVLSAATACVSIGSRPYGRVLLAVALVISLLTVFIAILAITLPLQGTDSTVFVSR